MAVLPSGLTQSIVGFSDLFSKPNSSTSTALMTKNPKDFLVAVMNDPATKMKTGTDAAKALMPFVHKKLGEGSRKDQKQEDAKTAANMFSPMAARKESASSCDFMTLCRPHSRPAP